MVRWYGYSEYEAERHQRRYWEVSLHDPFLHEVNDVTVTDTYGTLMLSTITAHLLVYRVLMSIGDDILWHGCIFLSSNK